MKGELYSEKRKEKWKTNFMINVSQEKNLERVERQEEKKQIIVNIELLGINDKCLVCLMC